MTSVGCGLVGGMLAGLVSVNCAAPSPPTLASWTADGALPVDASVPEGGCPATCSVSGDLAFAIELGSGGRDLSAPPDQAVAVDLAAAVDLAPPPADFGGLCQCQATCLLGCVGANCCGELALLFLCSAGGCVAH